MTPARRQNHAVYMRYRYQTDPVHREKQKARARLGHAIRRGHMQRQPCEDCGAERAQAHHDDYGQPLVVRWLCRTHHEARHGGPGCHGARA